MVSMQKINQFPTVANYYGSAAASFISSIKPNFKSD